MTLSAPEKLDKWIASAAEGVLEDVLLNLAEMIVSGEARRYLELEPEERLRRYAAEIERRNEHTGGV